MAKRTNYSKKRLYTHPLRARSGHAAGRAPSAARAARAAGRSARARRRRWASLAGPRAPTRARDHFGGTCLPRPAPAGTEGKCRRGGPARGLARAARRALGDLRTAHDKQSAGGEWTAGGSATRHRAREGFLVAPSAGREGCVAHGGALAAHRLEPWILGSQSSSTPPSGGRHRRALVATCTHTPHMSQALRKRRWGRLIMGGCARGVQPAR